MSFEPEFTQMPLAFSSRDNAAIHTLPRCGRAPTLVGRSLHRGSDAA